MSHLLEVNGLTTVFKGDYGKNTSVDHIHFHVDKGETVCIVGESGCGKSVTSLSIMGLLSRDGKVTDGTVLFDGQNLFEMTEKELDAIRGKSDDDDFPGSTYLLESCFYDRKSDYGKYQNTYGSIQE